MLGAGHQNVTANLPFCVVERGPLLFALALERGAPPVVAASHADRGVVCGTPLPGRDKVGGKMIRELQNSTRESCCAACTADPECTAWVRQPSNGNCWPCAGTSGASTPSADREVSIMAGRVNNGSSFGYAVACDASTMKEATSEVTRPFDWPIHAPPVTVQVQAAAFDWSTGPWLLPTDPIDRTGKRMVNLTLVPYGSAKVYHISMFPVLKQ
jgi:hypothetical protein